MALLILWPTSCEVLACKLVCCSSELNVNAISSIASANHVEYYNYEVTRNCALVLYAARAAHARRHVILRSQILSALRHVALHKFHRCI